MGNLFLKKTGNCLLQDVSSFLKVSLASKLFHETLNKKIVALETGNSTIHPFPKVEEPFIFAKKGIDIPKAVCQNGETKYFKTPPGNDGKSSAAVHGSVAALAK